MEDEFRFPVGKPEGKGPLWRPRRRWEHNIRMDLRKMVEGGWKFVLDASGS
jgi:hypothetical protein